MSMHMIHGVRAPVSGKKAKKKPGWRQREEEHRKWLIKMGIDPDAPKRRKKEFKPYVPEPTYRRETPHIPSLGTGAGVATKKETLKYTGDLIVGIATMHKSNAVPVMRNTSQAEDIAKMRR